MQFALFGVLIAGTIATCRACRDEPAAQPGGLSLRQAEYHIAHCPACRAAGVTAERMAAVENPTPCHADRYPAAIESSVRPDQSEH